MKETRNTFQKTAVFEMLQEMHDHPSADRVYERVRERYPNISRSTVYRILNQLAERGAVYKVMMPGAADRFDFNNVPHYHVHCIDCDEVYDIDLQWFEDLDQQAARASDFKILSHTVVFEGICSKCQTAHL